LRQAVANSCCFVLNANDIGVCRRGIAYCVYYNSYSPSPGLTLDGMARRTPAILPAWEKQLSRLYVHPASLRRAGWRYAYARKKEGFQKRLHTFPSLFNTSYYLGTGCCALSRGTARACSFPSCVRPAWGFAPLYSSAFMLRIRAVRVLLVFGAAFSWLFMAA